MFTNCTQIFEDVRDPFTYVYFDLSYELQNIEIFHFMFHFVSRERSIISGSMYRKKENV